MIMRIQIRILALEIDFYLNEVHILLIPLEKLQYKKEINMLYTLEEKWKSQIVIQINETKK